MFGYVGMIQVYITDVYIIIQLVVNCDSLRVEFSIHNRFSLGNCDNEPGKLEID